MTLNTHPATPELDAFRSAVLARDVTTTNSGWEDVLIPLGALLTGDALGDDEMLAWADRWLQHHATEVTTGPPAGPGTQQHSGVPHRGIFLSEYCGEWGVLSVLAEAQRQGRSATALSERIIQVADHICDGSFTIGNGVIAHSRVLPSPWVDTLYYSSAPLARAFAVTGVQRYADVAVQQCLLHAEYLRDERTGLFFHDADVETGIRTDWLWSRGNGWVVMAFADVLRFCPRETSGWSQLLVMFRSLCTGLLRLQHPSGLWRIVPENPESHLETSGSTMIATGLADGVSAGFLEPAVIPYIRRAWNETLTWIDDRGRLRGSQTPAGRGGWERHKRAILGETTYGTGSLLRLAASIRELESGRRA